MKALKRRLLFTLGHTGEVLLGKSDYVYFSLPELYWRMAPYAPVSVRQALGDLLGKKMANRVDRDGRVYYRLTSVGREYLFDFCNVPSSPMRVWDRGWRMVVVDDGVLKQGQVRWLRRQLRGLGFKPLSRGVWVTPQDVSYQIKKVLVKTKIAGGVVVLVTRRFIVGDDKAFAERVWSLEEMNNSYLEFVKQAEGLLRTVRGAKSLDDQLKRQFLLVFDRWYELLPLEPRLPKALLPGEWQFGEAGGVFGKLCDSVLELEREK
jgi:phenylacetic acid degradation operon negative regulatory protein